MKFTILVDINYTLSLIFFLGKHQFYPFYPKIISPWEGGDVGNKIYISCFLSIQIYILHLAKICPVSS